MKLFPFLVFIFFCQIAFAQLIVAEYTIKNIKENTKYSDYGTAFFGPNRVVFASSKHSRKKYEKNQDDAPRYDLFKGYVNLKGEINYVKKIKNNFSTKYNETNVSFTPDLKYVYFTQNNYTDGKYHKDDENWVNLKIYRAKVNTNGEWTHIIPLPFNSNTYSCAHPSVSEDGRILFFTSDMPGSLGQSDIYWVTIAKDGTYGEPQNMGTHVNSKAKENFPFIDGSILYFSSDRPESKGGLDVFMIEIDQPNSIPVNIGSPINSKYDDFCFVLNRQKKTGFFSSNRLGGKGEDDIYSFVQKNEIISCHQLVKGEIRDKKTNEIIPYATLSLYSHKNILLTTYPTQKNGKFEFKLACRDNYRIEVVKTNYKKKTKSIGYIPNTKEQKLPVFLESIKKPEAVVSVKNTEVVVGTEEVKPIIEEKSEISTNKPEESNFIIKDGKQLLNIEPIYFVLDESYITKASFDILEKVAQIIRENPTIIIEFGAHTDSRASASYNLHLSNLRAKEVVKYLMNLGVPENRIKGRGYGESQLVNHCKDGVKCTEAEHLQNRRTEFVIIQK